MNLLELKWSTVELLDPPETSFSEEGGKYAAIEFSAEQPGYLNHMLSRAMDLGRKVNAVENVGNFLKNALGEPLLKTIMPVSGNNGTYTIRSPYPLILQKAMADWDSNLNENIGVLSDESRRDLAWFILGALGFFAYRSKSIPSGMDIVSFPAFHAAMMEFSSLSAHQRGFSRDASPLLQRFDNFKNESKRIMEMAELERATHEKDAAELRARMHDAESGAQKAEMNFNHLRESFKKHLDFTTAKFEELALSANVRIETVRQDSEQKLLDHAKVTNERLNLRHVTQRWQDVKRRAKRVLWAAGIAIFVLFVSAAMTIVYWGHEILNFLTPLDLKTIYLNTTATGVLSMQIARVALLAIPLVSYFWLLKIAVRIFMRSLVIMDDADQRATIMDSYYALTGDGMTDERALPMMLWAIFRPLPGHGPDGIDPPDFTEAINAGLKIGGK